MAYDYDRTASANYDRTAAAKDPNVVAVNRIMSRMKPAVAKHLSDATGKEWSPSSHVKEWYNTVDYRWFSMDQETHVSWSVELHVSWNARTNLYEVRTTAEKGSRSVGFARQEGIKLEDFKQVGILIPKDVIADLQKAMEGSYEKELTTIKSSAAEILEKAQEAHKLAEEINALVKDDPLGNYAAISKRTHELSYRGSSIDHMSSSLTKDIDTIRSGR